MAVAGKPSRSRAPHTGAAHKPVARGNAAAPKLGSCLVCGQEVSRPSATLCLTCLRKNEKARRPKFPGGARTEHGTRVARAVVCVRCGKEDHVAFKPREAEKVMCRKCTEEAVGLDEHGDPTRARVVDITCPQCGRATRVPIMPPRFDQDGKEIPVVCRDCLLGIEVNASSRDASEVRRPGILLKRKKKEA